MSHYAKIMVVDGVPTVEQVIVADQDFIDTLPGEWIQTSYNTRGGVHYGADGLPDGGQPLRKNYAAIGYIYDRDLDAFYAPRPDARFILNLHTCLWEAPYRDQVGDDARWDPTFNTWVKVTPRAV